MVMLTNVKRGLGALVTAPLLGVMMTGGAAAAPETCDRRTARDLMRAGDYAGLCDCTQVTPSFLQRLQRGSNFEAVLGVTGEQCPGLAALLSDFATASGAPVAAFRGEDRSSDGNETGGDAPGGAPAGQQAGAPGGEPDGGPDGGEPDGGPDGGPEGGDPGGEPGGDTGGKPGGNADEAAEGADRAAEARARADAAREKANAKVAEARARAEAARSGSGSNSKGKKN